MVNNINKTSNHLPPEIIEHKKCRTYDIGNADTGFGQAHEYGRVKQINWIPTPLFIIGSSNGYTDMKKRY